jgi:hypothetical protein
MNDLLKDYWHVVLSVLAAVVFVIRMEGRMSFHGIEIKRLQKQRDDDQNHHQRSRDELHTMLRDMDSKLDRLIERNLK